MTWFELFLSVSFSINELMPKTLDAEEDGKGSLCALYRKETWSPKLEQAPRQCRRKHTLRSVSVRTCVTDTLACTRAALTLPQLKFFVPAGARVHRRRRTRCSLILLLLPGSRRMFSRIILYIYIYIKDFSYLSFFLIIFTSMYLPSRSSFIILN